ncbi:hypothetical protein [Aliikangiella sp. IMCC44632]
MLAVSHNSQFQNEFCENNFLVIKNALPLNICQLLSKRIAMLAAEKQLMDCEQCPMSHWAYDDPAFVEVQQSLRLSLSQLTGIELLNSFNSVRRYPQGEVLTKHTDRDAAEIVLSVVIDYAGTQHWPLYLQALADESPVNEIVLGQGDAVLFRGSKLYHWRESLANEWQIQAFFFFVDSNGDFKAHAGDMINKYKPR